MFNWEEADYLKLGGQNNLDIEPLLPSATEYVLEPGGIYFMPWDKYHVAQTNELSVSLSVWFDNHTTNYVAESLFFEVYDNFKKQQAEIPPLVRPADFGQKFNTIGQFLSANDLEKPLGNYLEEAYRNKMNLLLSNGGWSKNTITRQQETGSFVEDEQFFTVHKVQGVSPFKIRTEATTESIQVFARGHQVTFPYSSVVLQVIDLLNAGVQLTINEVPQLEQPDDRTLVLLLFAHLYNYKAIETA